MLLYRAAQAADTTLGSVDALKAQVKNTTISSGPQQQDVLLRPSRCSLTFIKPFSRVQRVIIRPLRCLKVHDIVCFCGLFLYPAQ